VPAAGAGEAGKDRRSSPTPLVADEQAVFAIQHNPLHVPLADIVVDGHRAIADEDVQIVPLVQRVVHGLGHRVLGKQVIFPRPQPLLKV